MSEAQTETPPRQRRPGPPDLLALVGVLLLSYGAWRAWAPSGFMVAGVALLAAALLGAAGERRPAK